MNAALLLVFAGLGATSLAAEPFGQFKQSGVASFYTESRKTATGARYDCNLLTAAHRTLAFGTVVVVRNLANGRTVNVRINDRGPFCKGRIIDVSKAAAQQLQMMRSGTAHVELIAQK